MKDILAKMTSIENDVTTKKPTTKKMIKESTVISEKSKSEKQARFMAAAAHDPKLAKKLGVPQKVAKEFNKADTGTKLLSNAMKDKPAKTEAKKPAKKKKVAEQRIVKKYSIIAESATYRVSNPALAKILRRFPHELVLFSRNDELADILFDALYDHYFDEGEMPYGVAKARDGDPYNWVVDKLHHDLQDAGMESPESAIDPVYEDDEFCDDDEEMVDEDWSFPQKQRARSISNPAARAEADAKWARAKGAIEGGNGGNPFHTSSTPYNVSKGSEDRHAEHAWRNFESVDPSLDEGTGGDIMPLESEGNVDEAILMEDFQEIITDILTGIGLEEDRDFLFDDGLVVFGESEARLAENAISQDERITGIPRVDHVQDEEYRITLDNDGDGLKEAFDIDKFKQAGETGDYSGLGDKKQELDRKYSALYAELKNPKTSMSRAVEVKQEMGKLRRMMQTMSGQLAKDKDTMSNLTPVVPAANSSPFAASKPQRTNQYNSKVNSGKAINEAINVTIAADTTEDMVSLIRKLSGLTDPISAPCSTTSITHVPVDSYPYDEHAQEYCGDSMSSLLSTMDSINDCDYKDDYCEDEYGKDYCDGIHDTVHELVGASDDYVDEATEDTDIDVDYANEPETSVYPEVEGNDLNRRKLSYSSKPYRGDNPMAEARQLMRQYSGMLNSIKK